MNFSGILGVNNNGYPPVTMLFYVICALFGRAVKVRQRRARRLVAIFHTGRQCALAGLQLSGNRVRNSDIGYHGTQLLRSYSSGAKQRKVTVILYLHYRSLQP